MKSIRSNKDVFIVIVSYNGLQWLPSCLDSCKGNEVVVVDNGSTDKSVEFIKNNHKNISLHELGKNFGFGRANNIGIKYALDQGAENILLLNQDAYLVDNAINELITCQNANPEYGIVSPIHITADRCKLDTNFSKYMAHPYNSEFYSDFVLSRKIKPIYEVPFVNAAAWLVSRNCIEKVGGFDPIFYHYGEDNNYCQRVRYHGFKIGIIPNAYIVHDREYREEIEIEKYTDKYFRQRITHYSSVYADILAKNNESLIDNKIRSLRKLALRQLVRGRFRTYRNIRKEANLLRHKKSAMLSSVNLNRTVGMHYLD